MRKDPILDLADCTEFRQTLLARPPRIAHGTVALLALLLGAALLWAFEQSLGSAWNADVKLAWATAYAQLARLMTDATRE